MTKLHRYQANLTWPSVGLFRVSLSVFVGKYKIRIRIFLEAQALFQIWRDLAMTDKKYLLHKTPSLSLVAL